MAFKDREQAGKLLAERLAKTISHVDVVVGIPRGGVATAAPVARRFKCPLMPVFAAKIRHPMQPEFAIGAMDERGHAHIADGFEESVSHGVLDEAKQSAMETIKKKKRLYGSFSANIELKGKIVVVVDDGLATGETCMAALEYLRSLKPKRLILAVPCTSTSGVEKVRHSCDEVVTLIPPDPDFMAVGDYYEDFTQVEDDVVLNILRSAA